LHKAVKPATAGAAKLVPLFVVHRFGPVIDMTSMSLELHEPPAIITSGSSRSVRAPSGGPLSLLYDELQATEAPPRCVDPTQVLFSVYGQAASSGPESWFPAAFAIALLYFRAK
jgi:hypothetical protein